MRHMTYLRAGLRSFALLAMLLLLIVPARAAVDIQEVRSQSGVTAWLVEDYTVPIVSIRFHFAGGSSQDPDDRLGIANLMTGLFDEGAGEMDSDVFQTAMDDAGAEMGFRASPDGIYGSMRTLAETRQEAFGLLALAVNRPRFDQAPLDRIRSQIITGIRASERDPQTLARRAFAKALYGDHPYARPSDGLPETLETVTPDDLRAFHGRIFARGELHVSVVGAIDAETVKAELDRIFGDLPAEPQLVEVPDVQPKLDQTVREVYPLPQASLQLVFPGVARKDPDFFAAFLMNHVLGGGVFTSRLFEEVREKRGLAYGVSSGLSNLNHAQTLMIGTATDAARADETLALIRDVVRRMAQEGPTEEELESAKRFQIGAYAISNLSSSASIATTLLELQIEELGIDYLDRREGLIGAVTREDATAAARRLLEAEPALLIVGPAASDGG